MSPLASGEALEWLHHGLLGLGLGMKTSSLEARACSMKLHSGLFVVLLTTPYLSCPHRVLLKDLGLPARPALSSSLGLLAT